MSRNDDLFARAQRSIPAGVNSPVRAFRSVGGTPRFFMRGEGAYLWDADGKRYIDYVGSWGPAIVGHAHPSVVRAVQETAAYGLSFGAPTELEIELARRSERWSLRVGRLGLTSWAADRRPAHHDGARASVICDRQVQPVRQQRILGIAITAMGIAFSSRPGRAR